jgi:hypothetical protein
LSRAVLRFPALVVLAAGLLALAVALVAAGTGLSGPPSATCAPPVPVGAAIVSGVPLDATQLANARIIYAVGAGLELPEDAEVIAIAMQESSLRNLPYGSADSLGLFQQRPSEGWGTPAQIMDPVTAARSFYDALTQVPGWQGLPVTAAAEAVQRSAFPTAYARWQPAAAELAASFSGAAAPCVTPG